MIRERPDNLKYIDSEEESELEEVEQSNKDTNSYSNGKLNDMEAEEDIDLSVYNDINIQSHLYNNILLIGIFMIADYYW